MLVSVQSVVVDPADRLWILDTGSPMFAPTGPKLVCVDLATDTVTQAIAFPPEVASPTYQGGQDLRRHPHSRFRYGIDAGHVRLR